MSVTSNETGETFWGDDIGIEWVTAADAMRALAARDAEIERLKRQLAWALRACGDDEALKFYGLDILAISDDDAGLLAAIDEATQEKPDPR